MLSKKELVEIINGLGDQILERDITIVEGKIIIQSAYSGRDFAWTVQKLQELERLTEMEARVHGGMYNHINIELVKPDASKSFIDKRGKVGDTVVHIIPMRSIVGSRDHLLELYDNVRSGKEDITSGIATDESTIKIVTKRIKK